MQFINKHTRFIKTIFLMGFVFAWLASTALESAAQQSRNNVQGSPPAAQDVDGTVATMKAYLDARPNAGTVADKSFPQGMINYGAQGKTNPSVDAGTNPGVAWPELVLPKPIKGSEHVAARMKMMNSILDNENPMIGKYPLTANFAAMATAVATQMEVDAEQSPEMSIPRAKEEQNQANQVSADTNAQQERQQAGTAIDYVAHYLYNFTVDKDNKWNQVRDKLFLPMAILVLLPGAVLAQVKAVVSAGTPVIQDVQSPFEGIMRSIVAIFLIPGTYLIINYGIDVSNSITYTIYTEYQRIFGTDMYKDAMCAHIRAFPLRNLSENKGFVPATAAVMGRIGKNDTPFAEFEGKNLNVKLLDPCGKLDMTPGDRTNEQVPYYVNAQRNSYNTVNSALAMTWNILCAFQMCYLYYLWFVGPVIAALWVYPMQQLRDAFPSWIDGVCTICFWSLFWNTAILLMACLRGVDETGTMMMTALNFLSTACVKLAFDFAALVKEAGMKAASVGASGGGGKTGATGAAGKSAGTGASPGAPHTPAAPSAHPVAAPHPVTAGSGSATGQSVTSINPGHGGATVGSTSNGDGTPTGGHTTGVANASWDPTHKINLSDITLPPGAGGSGHAVNGTHSPFGPDPSLFSLNHSVPGSGLSNFSVDGSGGAGGGGAAGDTTLNFDNGDTTQIFGAGGALGAGAAGAFGLGGIAGIGGNGANGANGDPSTGMPGHGANGDTHHNAHHNNAHFNAFLAGGGIAGVNPDGSAASGGTLNGTGGAGGVGAGANGSDMAAYVAGLAGTTAAAGAGNGNGNGTTTDSGDTTIDSDFNVDLGDTNVNMDQFNSGSPAMLAAAGTGGFGVGGGIGDPNAPPSSLPQFAKGGLDLSGNGVGGLPPAYAGLTGIGGVGATGGAGDPTGTHAAAANHARESHLAKEMAAINIAQTNAAANAAGTAGTNSAGGNFNLNGPNYQNFSTASASGTASPLGFDPSGGSSGTAGNPLSAEFAKLGVDIAGMQGLTNQATGGTSGVAAGGTDTNNFIDNNTTFGSPGSYAAAGLSSITGQQGSATDNSASGVGGNSAPGSGPGPGSGPVPSFVAADPGASNNLGLFKTADAGGGIDAGAAMCAGMVGAHENWQQAVTGMGIEGAKATVNYDPNSNLSRASNPGGMGANLGNMVGLAPTDASGGGSGGGTGTGPSGGGLTGGTNNNSGSGSSDSGYGSGGTYQVAQGPSSNQGFGGYDKSAGGGDASGLKQPGLMDDQFKAFGSQLTGLPNVNDTSAVGSTIPQVGGTMNPTSANSEYAAAAPGNPGAASPLSMGPMLASADARNTQQPNGQTQDGPQVNGPGQNGPGQGGPGANVIAQNTTTGGGDFFARSSNDQGGSSGPTGGDILRGQMVADHEKYQNQVTDNSKQIAEASRNAVEASGSQARNSLEGNMTNIASSAGPSSGTVPGGVSGLSAGGSGPSPLEAAMGPASTSSASSYASASAPSNSATGAPSVVAYNSTSSPSGGSGGFGGADGQGNAPRQPGLMDDKFRELGSQLTGLPTRDDSTVIGSTIPQIGNTVSSSGNSEYAALSSGGAAGASSLAAGMNPGAAAPQDARTGQPGQPVGQGDQQRLAQNEQRFAQNEQRVMPSQDQQVQLPGQPGNTQSQPQTIAQNNTTGGGDFARSSNDGGGVGAVNGGSIMRDQMVADHAAYRDQVTDNSKQIAMESRNSVESASSQSRNSLEGNMTNIASSAGPASTGPGSAAGPTPIDTTSGGASQYAGSLPGSLPGSSASSDAGSTSYTGPGSTTYTSAGSTQYASAALDSPASASSVSGSASPVGQSQSADRSAADGSQAAGLRQPTVMDQQLREFGSQLTGLPTKDDSSAVGKTIPTIGGGGTEYAAASSGGTSGASAMPSTPNGGASAMPSMTNSQASAMPTAASGGASAMPGSSSDNAASSGPQFVPANGGNQNTQEIRSAQSEQRVAPTQDQQGQVPGPSQPQAYAQNNTSSGAEFGRSSNDGGGAAAINGGSVIRDQMVADHQKFQNDVTDDSKRIAMQSAGSVESASSQARNSLEGNMTNMASSAGSGSAGAAAMPADRTADGTMPQSVSSQSQSSSSSRSADSGSATAYGGTGSTQSSTAASGATEREVGRSTQYASAAPGYPTSASDASSPAPAPAQSQAYERSASNGPETAGQNQPTVMDQQLREFGSQLTGLPSQDESSAIGKTIPTLPNNQLGDGNYAAAALPAAGMLAASALRKPQPSGVVVNNRSEAYRMVQKGTSAKMTGKESASKLSAALGRAKTPPAGPTDPKMQFNPRKLADPMGSVASGTALRRLRSARKTSNDELEILRKLGGINDADKPNGDK